MANSLTEYLKELPGFRYAGAVRKSDILRAERALRLNFSDEYRDYLLTYGFASAKGLELTGLNVNRLNVVTVTQREKLRVKAFPSNMYVVIDDGEMGLEVLQKTDGTVYELYSSGRIDRVADDLTSYLAYRAFLLEEDDDV